MRAEKRRVKKEERAPNAVNTREDSPSISVLNKKFNDIRNIMPLASAIKSIFIGGKCIPKGASITTKMLNSPT
ncbi:MAG: hypothetical protein V1891_01950 [bacterium]